MPNCRFALVAAVVSLAGCGGASSTPPSPHVDHALGTVEFPISCSADAQAAFNHGMALLHHMTYPQAREVFATLAAEEPGCAMASWGEAMTLFQPLWPTRPSPAALAHGWTLVQRATSLAPPTERERLFVASAAAFFEAPESADYWLRIRRWEDSLARAHAALPADAEVTLWRALAHLATTPGDTISRAHADTAAALLLRVYEQNPDHPGAMHYLVHANDVPGRERELVEITRKYDAAAPRNPHALHMPTHIYTRLGDWPAVIQGNERAAAAALEHPAGDQGQFVWDEFPHAIEYLVYAHLQRGDDDRATAERGRLFAVANLEPTFKTAFHLASTTTRLALERKDWAAAAAIVPREPASLSWDRFAWPEAVQQFGRGLGAAHLGQTAVVSATIARLTELEAGTRDAGEALFARNIAVLRLELQGWQAHARGARADSVRLLREAAALEASTPKHAVTPGPTVPAQELLGDALMLHDQPAEALTAYTEALRQYPGRFNTLLGAARAARASGDENTAREHDRTRRELAPDSQRKTSS
jgi:tetratricopeptide (TPR) repeat protein